MSISCVQWQLCLKQNGIKERDHQRPVLHRRIDSEHRPGAKGTHLDCRQVMSWMCEVRLSAILFPKLPEWRWNAPGNVSNVSYEDSDRGVQMSSLLHLLQRSRPVELHFHPLIGLHGFVIKELNTFTQRTFESDFCRRGRCCGWLHAVPQPITQLFISVPFLT
jgi:hypothetical protein